MKTSNLMKLLSIVGLALGLFAPRADAYLADAKNQLSALDTTGTSRFFAGTAEAPGAGFNSLTTGIYWFVADTAGNGIQNPSTAMAGDILGADDRILWQDFGDGSTATTTLLGRFARNGIPVNDSYANNNIYVYVWNRPIPVALPHPGAAPASEGGTDIFVESSTMEGYKFGVLQLGVRPPPPTGGNGSWAVFADVYADTFTVAAVPEPSTFALAGLGLVGLIGYRRFKK